MKKDKNVKTIMILSIILLIAFSGCTTKDKTVVTPDGDVKVPHDSGPGTAWCKAGTKFASEGAHGEPATYEIKGIVNFEGKEVCLSVITSDRESIEQYYNEDHSVDVKIVKDKSGKEISRQKMPQPPK